MAAYSGFPEESYDSVFITLDKMDKIGLEGVEAELLENGFDKACVDKYLELFKGLESAEDGVAYLADTLEGFLEPEIARASERSWTASERRRLPISRSCSMLRW